MSKPIPFKERFKGQIQCLGKGGIQGTQIEEPIRIEGPGNQMKSIIEGSCINEPNIKNKYEENSFLKKTRLQESSSKIIGSNGTMIIPQQPQYYSLNPYMNIQPMNPYINPMGNPYTNPIMCLPNMTFGQHQYMPQPYHQQMPIYQYIPSINQPMHNINDISQYSQINQTAIQLSKPRLRPISSQNRTVESSKINDTSSINNTNNGNMNNISNRITSANGRSRYITGEYKPYTLKEYKELAKVGIVLGGLGPNIGTKDWEEKKVKMKKMEVYSNNINSLKQIKKKKESLENIVQKEKKKKIESSNRKKCYEYGNLIRPKSRIGPNPEDCYESSLFKDLGIINEKQNELIKEQFNQNKTDKIELNCFPSLDKENIMKPNMYCDMPNYANNNMITRYPDDSNSNSNRIISLNDDNQYMNIEQICKERENYKAKIESIKDTLMK